MGSPPCLQTRQARLSSLQAHEGAWAVLNCAFSGSPAMWSLNLHGAALQGCVPELDQSLMLSTLLLFPQPAQGSVMDMLHLKFTPLISLMDSLMYHEPSSVV